MLGRGMRPERGCCRGGRGHGAGGRPARRPVTSHACDVSDEAQVLRFRDELLEEHASDHVDLVFSNAGIGGGESFSRVPAGVGAHVRHRLVGGLLLRRAFLPLLIASGDGVLVTPAA